MKRKIYLTGILLSISLISISFLLSLGNVRIFDFKGFKLSTIGIFVLAFTLLFNYYSSDKFERIKYYGWQEIAGYVAIAMVLNDLLLVNNHELIGVILWLVLIIGYFYRYNKDKEKLKNL